MTFVRGNRAIRDHAGDGKDLLLFEAVKPRGHYRYLGVFDYAGCETIVTPDGDGHSRNAIRFILAPITDIPRDDDGGSEPAEVRSLAELRQLAYAAAEQSDRGPQTGSARVYYERSRAVKAYVLARANGVCECCQKPAPFTRADGSPYLEPHHTHRRSDGGLDFPDWVGAICPNCHREIQHGVNGHALNAGLRAKLAAKEGALDPQREHAEA